MQFENDRIIKKAVALLSQGYLIGLPTETVYGLAADASNLQAVADIFAAKGRPADHPLIVHLAEGADLLQWAREVSPEASLLAAAFWPGPLTLILKKQPGVSDLITGGQDTVGLRQPAHVIAQGLLRSFGGALVAPSANRFGRISPTTAEAVREELGSAVSLVLDGGMCQGGIESTIVDCSADEPVILRPGILSAEKIGSVLGRSIGFTRQNAPRVSGSHSLHYAPETQTRLLSYTQIEEALRQCTDRDFPLAVVLHSRKHLEHPAVYLTLMPDQPTQYAHDLYQTLRSLDKKQFKSIWIEALPKGADWEAISDRLKRATFS